MGNRSASTSGSPPTAGTSQAGDYAAVLAKAGSGHPEGLLLPDWGEAEWRMLLAWTDVVAVRAGDVVIERGEKDHGLLFIASGRLEVSAASGDGVTMNPLVPALPGSVVGEVAFFDRQPRSASAWAATDAVLLRLSAEAFGNLAEAQPALARDLLLALGRVLALRLRRASSRRL